MTPRCFRWRLWLVVGLVPAGLWLAGFAAFIVSASRPVPPPPVAQGIVALTGGGDRIEAALRLLASGGAERLLISGIGGGIDLAALARRAGVGAGLGHRVAIAEQQVVGLQDGLGRGLGPGNLA